jgi:hypothetical protein
MMNLERKATKSALILITSAFMVMSGCGKHSKFDGSGKGAGNGDSKDGTNDIYVSEGGVADETAGAAGDGSTGTAGAETKDADQLVREATTDVGIKNFLQINATFSALTGVPTTQAAVNTAFQAVKTQLPSGNSIKTFSASVQVAVSKLAAAYCDVSLNDATLRAKIVPNFNFAGNVATALDAAGQETMINGLMASFWGDLASGVDQTASKAMLATLMTDLRTGLETGAVAQTHAIAVGMCTGTLASSPVTFL